MLFEMNEKFAKMLSFTMIENNYITAFVYISWLMVAPVFSIDCYECGSKKLRDWWHLTDFQRIIPTSRFHSINCQSLAGLKGMVTPKTSCPGWCVTLFMQDPSTMSTEQDSKLVVRGCWNILMSDIPVPSNRCQQGERDLENYFRRDLQYSSKIKMQMIWCQKQLCNNLASFAFTFERDSFAMPMHRDCWAEDSEQLECYMCSSDGENCMNSVCKGRSCYKKDILTKEGRTRIVTKGCSPFRFHSQVEGGCVGVVDPGEEWNRIQCECSTPYCNGALASVSAVVAIVLGAALIVLILYLSW